MKNYLEQSAHTPSKEVLQGLFGELYFIKKVLLNKHPIETIIQGWSGPDSKSKDFSFGTTWYEIKTIGTSVTEVRISSLAQLSSKYDGNLIIIRVEGMSDNFSNGESCIGELFTSILSMIADETIEGMFLAKMASLGFDSTDTSFNAKFDVKSIESYIVDNNFPKLTESSINFPEIGNVTYTLIVNALEKYKGEL